MQELLNQLRDIYARLSRLRYRRPTRLTPLVQRQANALIKEMTDFGYKVMVFEGFRSFERQDELYAQGRTKPGAIITNARAGESLHNYGVAVDVVFVENNRPSWGEHHNWYILGEVGKKHGFSWGGDWKGFVDRPHFEMTMGYNLNDFKNNKVDYLKYV